MAIRGLLVRSFAALSGVWAAASLASAWLVITRPTAAPLILLATVGIAGAISYGVGVVALRAVDRVEGDRVELREAWAVARADVLADGLTGLGSARALGEELALAVAQAAEGGPAIALLMIDLDDLKKTNESQGRGAGDELLRATARIITSSLRRGDRGFRVGGDEFAVVLRGCDADAAAPIGWRILSEALSGGSGTLGVAPFSLTIGVSALPGLAADRRQLQHQAMAALSWGKRHGRTDVQVFDPARHGIADDWRTLDELSSAVARVAAQGLLSPVYQPIHSLQTGRVLGYEGLVRPNPAAGFADASALFTAAEATNRTVELDLASLTAVLAGAGSLDAGQYLSVNLSPRSLESDAFKPHELLAMLRRRGIEPARVVLELTEREAVEDLGRVRRAVEACRAAGMKVAADDVGAGNAGLRLLSQLRFDIVKIDLSLVQGGAVQATSLEVVKTLRDLAARWGALVVAEGIETPAQLHIVRSLGIDAAQGYLLGRPSDQPPTTSIDLDGLVHSDWLTERLRTVPA